MKKVSHVGLFLAELRLDGRADHAVEFAGIPDYN